MMTSKDGTGIDLSGMENMGLEKDPARCKARGGAGT